MPSNAATSPSCRIRDDPGVSNADRRLSSRTRAVRLLLTLTP